MPLSFTRRTAARPPPGATFNHQGVNLEMSRYRRRTALALLALALPLLGGCRGRTGAVEATPEKARETLRQGLEAWKNGKSAKDIQSGDAIVFADSDLEKGMKLLAYEVQGDGESDGFDWQCRVKLSLQDAKGAKSEVRAVYNVNTSPKLVIVRMEF